MNTTCFSVVVEASIDSRVKTVCCAHLAAMFSCYHAGLHDAPIRGIMRGLQMMYQSLDFSIVCAGLNDAMFLN